MTEEQKTIDAKRGRSFPWLLASIALLSAYIISVGPVHWAASHGILPGRSMREAINAFYTPLGFLSDMIPPLRRLFEWWATLF